MKKTCILSDFDGTISSKDGLYSFIQTYAKGDWEKIEQDWTAGKISSKECLIEEFKLVPNLSEELISTFIESMTIDETFIDFYKTVKEKQTDFYIVSDGIDFFINKILAKYNIQGIKVITNHGEFKNNKFEITFPNDSNHCVNNAGTCKCAVVAELRKQYEKIIYIGDGVSDFCVADKADVLYAKKRLLKYCSDKNIKCFSYEKFADIKFV